MTEDRDDDAPVIKVTDERRFTKLAAAEGADAPSVDVPEADKTELATATDALKEALKDQDADAAKLQAAHEAVMAVFSRVGQAMYQSAQAAQDPAGGAGDAGTASGAEAPADDDEVVEGEIVEEGDAS